MSYKVLNTSTFRKEIKRLSKRHSSISEDLAKLVEKLKVEPQQGVPIGKNCYKIRLAISSKHQGKSSGARVITQILVIDQTVYLLSIYDKSEKSALTEKELKNLLSKR